jgi:hypothetical protein
MSQYSVFNRTHYHIRWHRKDSLDWECFDSYSEAIASAYELAAPGEQFTIEEVSSSCPLQARTPGFSSESQQVNDEDREK